MLLLFLLSLEPLNVFFEEGPLDIDQVLQTVEQDRFL